MEKVNTIVTSDAISDHNSLSRSIGNNYQQANNADEDDSIDFCQKHPKRIKSPSRTQRKKQQSAAKRRSKARL